MVLSVLDFPKCIQLCVPSAISITCVPVLIKSIFGMEFKIWSFVDVIYGGRATICAFLYREFDYGSKLSV